MIDFHPPKRYLYIESAWQLCYWRYIFLIRQWTGIKFIWIDWICRLKLLIPTTKRRMYVQGRYLTRTHVGTMKRSFPFWSLLSPCFSSIFLHIIPFSNQSYYVWFVWFWPWLFSTWAVMTRLLKWQEFVCLWFESRRFTPIFRVWTSLLILLSFNNVEYSRGSDMIKFLRVSSKFNWTNEINSENTLLFRFDLIQFKVIDKVPRKMQKKSWKNLLLYQNSQFLQIIYSFLQAIIQKNMRSCAKHR